VVATLRVAVDRINAAPTQPEFLLHTGDISHLSKPSEFDTVDQVLKEAKARRVFYVPGEHDVLATTASSIWNATARERKVVAVQLRSEGGAFHRPGERSKPQGRGPR